MEWGLKIVVIAMLLIVFFVIVVMLMTSWSGQSNNAVNGIFDFLKGLGGGQIK